MSSTARIVAAFPAHGEALDIASNWDLPSDWTTVDTVFTGGGVKSGFTYFQRDDEYCRFDRASNARSPGYPKQLGPNWHTTPDFARGIDGGELAIGRDERFGLARRHE